MTLMIISKRRPGQRRKDYLLLLSLFVMMLLCVSGCVRPDTGFTVHPEAFSAPPDVYADMNTTQVSMSVGETMLVSYPWTPEDGRYWRVSVTEWLYVTGDRYIPFPIDMPVEVSGMREWMVRATSPGTQTFIGNLRPRATSWNQESVQRKIMVTVMNNEQGKSAGFA